MASTKTYVVAESHAVYGTPATYGDVQSIALRLTGTNAAVSAIKAGLPVSALLRLQEFLGVSRAELAQATNIAERTLAYRLKEKGGRLKTDESERVLRIALLADRAAEVMGDRELGTRWLQTPAHALDGATPLEYASTEPGAREVEDLLGQLEHGVFP